ncbi:hypothetical protein SPFM15_00055 [Salmonella phage SPFM15]|nr:hypothetical protein SPFM5_00050 [Salmonella phage SPFM5]VFR13679.1 hypothetical protein SPFM15_00055 [Salmonella phage SPFM15]
MNPFKESTRFLAIPDFTITRPSMLTSELTEEAWIMYDWYPWIEQHAGHFQKPVVVIPHSDLTPGRLASAWDGEERHAFLEELRYYYNEVQVDAPIERPVLTFNLWPYADLDEEMLLTLKNEVQAMLMTIQMQDWNKKFAERDKRALQNAQPTDLEVYRMRFTDAWAEVVGIQIFDTRIGWAKVLQPDVLEKL